MIKRNQHPHLSFYITSTAWSGNSLQAEVTAWCIEHHGADTRCALGMYWATYAGPCAYDHVHWMTEGGLVAFRTEADALACFLRFG